ncbi:MAG: guanylate kinase, partial [Actinobacteria bacterium]|nr:guanylate kinase [Actinomycetota bacterium]
MSTRGVLLVLSGPGGVGKSTVVSELRNFENFYFSVSATTRRPRANEIDGVAYHFVSEDSFQQMIEKGEFLEWAEFAGAKYGTPRMPVVDALESG